MDSQEPFAERPRGVVADLHPSSLAIAALEQAGPDDACLAFKDAAAVYARTPSALNAHKVEIAMRALRYHRREDDSRLSG